jgi:hypothetical protein
MGAMLTRSRNRLLLKITGWPRIGFLKALFPDAKFIHVQRDGRSVANSLLDVPWWNGYQGPQNWRAGELPDDYLAEWKAHGQSFIALAGINWKMWMDAFERSKPFFDETNFLEIRYEDLYSDPVDVMKKAVAFSEIDWSPTFEKTIRQFQLRDENKKWKSNLTVQQQDVLQQVLADHLQRYGY